MRGATRTAKEVEHDNRISIHAPHAGCDEHRYRSRMLFNISIHAPHAGCDTERAKAKAKEERFQSTHPMRGATLLAIAENDRNSISIHAPHAGCDGNIVESVQLGQIFNPRTPCGVRPYPCPGLHQHRIFNPRTPCGVRPTAFSCAAISSSFSIHAPHAGCDSKY